MKEPADSASVPSFQSERLFDAETTPGEEVCTYPAIAKNAKIAKD
jgi:hypothetical protein